MLYHDIVVKLISSSIIVASLDLLGVENTQFLKPKMT